MYEELEEKTKRIVKLGIELANDKNYKTNDNFWCTKKKCASCLAADARSKDDETEGNNVGLSKGDICMNDARNILVDKLGWNIN
jgi:hypothetical protein